MTDEAIQHAKIAYFFLGIAAALTLPIIAHFVERWRARRRRRS